MVHESGTGKVERLLATCKHLEPVPTAVAHPCEASALSGAIEAAHQGLIVPILVGPRAKIEATAKAAQVDLSGFEIIDAPHSNAAAAMAVGLGRVHTNDIELG